MTHNEDMTHMSQSVSKNYILFIDQVLSQNKPQQGSRRSRVPKESQNGQAKAPKKVPPPPDTGRVAELEKEVCSWCMCPPWNPRMGGACPGCLCISLPFV